MSRTRVDRKLTCTAATGQVHHFEVKPRAMSISFILSSAAQVDADHPKYLLESHDGAYSKELSAKNDLVPFDQYLQLRFEDLRPNRRYTLVRKDSDTESDVVFRDVPYATIIDQAREAHQPLSGHDYALGEVQPGPTAALAPFDLGTGPAR